jgi:hypothetical protein
MRTAADGKIRAGRRLQSTLQGLAVDAAGRVGSVVSITFELHIYPILTAFTDLNQQELMLARQTIIGSTLCPQLNLSLAGRRAGPNPLFHPPVGSGAI